MTGAGRRRRAGEQPDLPPLDDEAAVVAAAVRIVEVFDRRPDLYLAAAANPILALRDAGVRLGPEAERYVARRCRFAPEEAEALDVLERRIADALGPIAPDDDAAVIAALGKLGVKVPAEPRPRKRPAASKPATTKQIGTDAPRSGPMGGGTPRGAASIDRAARRKLPLRRSALDAAATLPQVQRWRQVRRDGSDPLERVRDAHEVVPALIEYRARSATALRFAPPELYERLKATTGGQLADGLNLSIRVRVAGDR